MICFLGKYRRPTECVTNLSSVPHRWSPSSALAERNLEKKEEGEQVEKERGERGRDKKGIEEKRKRSF